MWHINDELCQLSANFCMQHNCAIWLSLNGIYVPWTWYKFKKSHLKYPKHSTQFWDKCISNEYIDKFKFRNIGNHLI